MRDNQAEELSDKANMLWNAAGSLAYLAAQWLITILVVRLSSGYDAAGLLALGMAVSNIFSPIGYYKVRAYQVSDLRGEYRSSEYVGFRFVTIGISVLVMIVYGCLTCAAPTWPCVFLYGVYSLGPIFVDVLHGEDQKRHRMDVIGKSLVLRGILSLAAFVLGMMLAHSLEVALALMIVSTFAVIVLYDMRMTAGFLGVDIMPSFNRRALRSLALGCLPLVIAYLFCSATPVIPRQVLGSLCGESSLGIYASVASPVLIVQMCAQYIYSPLLTRFAEYSTEGDVERFRRLLFKITLAIVASTLVCVVGFLLLGEWALVILYGESIAPYSYLLVPLVACTALTAFIWFLGDLLIVLRKTKENLVGYALSFIVCILVMVPFVSWWEMNGVSFSVIVAFVVTLGYFSFCVFRSLARGDSDCS